MGGSHEGRPANKKLLPLIIRKKCFLSREGWKQTETRKWPLKHRWWIRDVFHACTTSVTNKDLHWWHVSDEVMMNGRHGKSWQTYWLAVKIQRCRIMFQCSRTRCTVWLQLDIHSINLAVALHHPSMWTICQHAWQNFNTQTHNMPVYWRINKNTVFRTFCSTS